MSLSGAMEPRLTGAEYQVLVEQAPMLIWRAGITGECVYFNERWLTFRGRTTEQERGYGWAEGVHPEDFEKCLRIYQDAFAKREVFEMEYRLLRADGAYRWILDRGSPFYSEEGEFSGYIGSCVDVTDRVQAQEALLRVRLAEMSGVQALLAICGYCRKVRDDSGFWKQVDEYVAEHSLIEFTHVVCPECEDTQTNSPSPQ
jgi:PAS domain S-box-containing protein